MRLSLLPFLLVLAAIGCSSKSGPTDKPGGTDEAGGQATGEATVNRELTGEVSIDGSSTVYPISEAAAAQFQKLYPNVGVTVGQSGTGGGFKRFTKGEVDISDASRPIKAKEFEAAREAGVAFVEMPIAYDGLTIVVHPKNDWVDQITVAELKKIFTAGGAAKNWSDVREGWPKEPIAIFAPGTDSGTFDYFNEVIAGDDGQMRSDMSTSEDDNVLVTGVAGSPAAIGFFGVAYYEENRDKLKAVPVVNPETGEAVVPNAETIESGQYAPFSRPLFIYVNAAALRRPEIKRFTQFYLDSAPELAAGTGYVALPSSVYDRVRANLQSRKTGTHYLNEDGESRSGPVTEIYAPENLTSF